MFEDADGLLPGFAGCVEIGRGVMRVAEVVERDGLTVAVAELAIQYEGLRRQPSNTGRIVARRLIQMPMSGCWRGPGPIACLSSGDCHEGRRAITHYG